MTGKLICLVLRSDKEGMLITFRWWRAEVLKHLSKFSHCLIFMRAAAWDDSGIESTALTKWKEGTRYLLYIHYLYSPWTCTWSIFSSFCWKIPINFLPASQDLDLYDQVWPASQDLDLYDQVWSAWQDLDLYDQVWSAWQDLDIYDQVWPAWQDLDLYDQVWPAWQDLDLYDEVWSAWQDLDLYDEV